MPETIVQSPLQPPRSPGTDKEKRVLQPFETSSEYIGSILAALGTRCFIPTLPLSSKR